MKSPADMPFDEPQYTVEDLGGHRWTFSQSIADVPFEAWGATPARPTLSSGYPHEFVQHNALPNKALHPSAAQTGSGRG
jgi:hypothetical protein